MFNMPAKFDVILRHINDFSGVFPENFLKFSSVKLTSYEIICTPLFLV